VGFLFRKFSKSYAYKYAEIKLQLVIFITEINSRLICLFLKFISNFNFQSKISMEAQSKYLQNAKFRIENKKWLSYSSNIALRVLAALEENENMTNESLAQMIGVSPEYLNKILKGQENLSLETIAKLSEALNVELITFPKFLFDQPVNKLFK